MKIISSFLIFFFLILYGSEWIYGEETVDFSVKPYYLSHKRNSDISKWGVRDAFEVDRV